MPKQREPIQLVVAKRKKHLTQKEVDDRIASEVQVLDDNIKAPLYLNKKARAEFSKIAAELKRIGIIGNLDCDVLARYVIAQENYLKYTKLLNKVKVQTRNEKNKLEISLDGIQLLDRVSQIQDKAFKQCQATARDLGLTITSRCRLVIPKAEEPPPNKFSEFEANG